MYLRPAFAVNTSEYEMLPLSIVEDFIRIITADLELQFWFCSFFFFF